MQNEFAIGLKLSSPARVGLLCSFELERQQKRPQQREHGKTRNKNACVKRTQERGPFDHSSLGPDNSPIHMCVGAREPARVLAAIVAVLLTGFVYAIKRRVSPPFQRRHNHTLQPRSPLVEVMSRNVRVLHVQPWGQVSVNGTMTPCDLVTFGDADRLLVSVTNYGGYLQRVRYRDSPEEEWADLILGYDTLDEYVVDPFYLGSTVGRYANRIANGELVVDGVKYQLARNNGPNALHGGPSGFGKRVWQYNVIDEANCAGIALRYVASEGEEGYPGSLDVVARYTVNVCPVVRVTTEQRVNDGKMPKKPTAVPAALLSVGTPSPSQPPRKAMRDPPHAADTIYQQLHHRMPPALSIEFVARTTRATIVSIVNHAYWNLSGYTSSRRPSGQEPLSGGSPLPAEDITSHELHVASDFFLPVDADRTPTGEVRSVKGTSLDFREMKQLRHGINDGPTAGSPGGYDHCLILRGPPPAASTSGGGGVRPCAVLRDPNSGRFMTVQTSNPALQVYSANFVRPSRGHGGSPFGFRSGLCLETQQLPSAPTFAHFPSALVTSAAPYVARTVHTFGRFSSSVPLDGGKNLPKSNL